MKTFMKGWACCLQTAVLGGQMAVHEDDNGVLLPFLEVVHVDPKRHTSNPIALC